MSRFGITIAIVCGALLLAAVLALPRVPHQRLLDATEVTKGN
jgi:hypothetical protein